MGSGRNVLYKLLTLFFSRETLSKTLNIAHCHALLFAGITVNFWELFFSIEGFTDLTEYNNVKQTPQPHVNANSK